MTLLDLFASLLLTLVLHATVLLGAAWALSKLVRDAWAEPLWRAALLGALLSTAVQGGALLRDAAEAAARRTAVVEGAHALPMPAPGAQARAASVADEAASARSRSADAIGPAPDAGPHAAIAADPASSVGGDALLPRAGQDTTAPAFATATADTPSLRAATRDATAPAPITASTRHVRAELPVPVALLLLFAWLVATLLAALRLLRQWRTLRAVAAHAVAEALPVPLAMQLQVRRLADELRVPAPTLHLVDGLASPMLAGRGRLLLPAWTPSLTPKQQQALLAHELAHVQRRDTAWKTGLRLATLPLAFHPLATLALRRLDALAEDACDARAAAAQGDGRALAECLAACLSRHPHAAAAPALAVAMADEPGPVVRRVRNLLEDTAMSNRPLPTTHRRATLALALTAALVLPGLAITTLGGTALADALAPGVFSASSLFDGTGRQVYRETDDAGNVLRFELRGDVVFTDDESDVASLGTRGAMTLERRMDDGSTRRFDIEAGKDGQLVRRYRVDDEDRPFDAAARAWLATELPVVLRETGLNAEKRGKRILERGGVDALLAEIALTRKDHATRRYLEVLFANVSLDDLQQQRALDATTAIESDFEQRHALQAMLAAQTLGSDRQAQLLQVARDIDSAFERAELLMAMAVRHAPTAATRPAWQETLAGIGSDFELRRTLEAMVDAAPGAATSTLVLDVAAEEIGSDFELRQLLEKTVAEARHDGAVRTAWLAGLAEISSDFETREALVSLVGDAPVDVALADAVLAVLPAIGSDFEAREVLVALAAQMPADAALVERYRAASRRLGDFERGQAERALDRFAAN